MSDEYDVEKIVGRRTVGEIVSFIFLIDFSLSAKQLERNLKIKFCSSFFSWNIE